MKELVEACRAKVPSLSSIDVDLVIAAFASSRKLHTTRKEELALLASVSSSFGTKSRAYQVLGARVLLTALYESTAPCFSEYVEEMNGILTPQLVSLVRKHKSTLNAAIDAQQDNNFDMIGLKTLLRSYLLKKNGVVLERPQYLYMRVALGIHGEHIEDALHSYSLMSQRCMTHATPTMFNAGVGQQQLASCFLLTMREDSIQGIYDTITQCAKISKHAGGIGLNISSIRASGSHIAGTQGTSNGLVPMLRVFNATAAYVDQCFVPETIVYTPRGPMEMQHVVEGETRLFNVKGEAALVEKVLEHAYNGAMFEISTMHSLQPMIVTPEHPLLVVSGQTQNYRVLRNRLEKGLVELEYKEAKDCAKMDLMAISIPTFEKDRIEISAEDCYFYGLLLGDGFCERGGSGHLTLHSVTKRAVLDFAVQYLHGKCVHCNITTKTENCNRIRWSASLALPFRRSELYDEQGVKRVHPKWLNLPIQKALQIVRGLIDTDGCKGKELVFDSTSRNLIESMRYLLLRAGIPSSGYERDRRGESHITVHGDRIENKKISWTLRIPKTEVIAELLGIEAGRFVKFLRVRPKGFSADLLFTRIKTVQRAKDYNGILYDFKMPVEHNYLIHNGIVHNGGGKRKGGFAMYLEPWHPDIEAFLDLKKNTGVESARARDLFYALWVPDLFMQRVRADKNWSLICPTQCPALATTCGEAWERLYLDCEKRGVASKTVSARKLWLHFMDTQLETGMPYLMFKDTVNAKSNQKNLGTIRGSNLCSEVTEFTSPDEVAVCTLASLALPQFVEDGVFNYRKLEEVVAHTVKSLDRVIDVTFYPVPEARVSNMRHRPIGIGANGFHDVLFKLEQPWESAEAQQTNKNIFETIYWAAMRASIDLAKELGHYESFPGSPLSEGQFQFDLWGQKATDRYDWESLREEVQTHGARHSLLIALMPTASSAQIIGNTEGVDALTSNLYVRRVSAGEYVVMNKYLEGDLRSRGLWSEDVRELLVAHKGSVQKLPIPDDMKKLYKCAFEVTHKSVLDMAIGRGPFVCQSQSMNLHIPNTTQGKLTSSHFYAFDNGLKTASYYVRTKSKVEAVAVTVRKELLESKEVECEMCSA